MHQQNYVPSPSAVIPTGAKEVEIEYFCRKIHKPKDFRIFVKRSTFIGYKRNKFMSNYTVKSKSIKYSIYKISRY